MTDASIVGAGNVADRPPEAKRRARGRPRRDELTVVSLEQERPRFDALYRSEWHGIVALGWSVTGSWVAAEELAQEAFADAFRRWPEVGRLERPGAWVRRAVLNRSASYHRSRASEQRGLARWSSQVRSDAERPSADHTGDGAVDHVGDPDFWSAVRSLPDRQAACVALHYLEDRSTAEIAEVLGCSPATVKVHLHRGRHALARRLERSTTDLRENER